MLYKNPIIPGYNPDPSICRVGEDYYLVTSTFEYFPGVPVYHSRDLINWRCIGHCLTRNSQLPLHGARCSGGIFAPTIRYHDGVFYMITTNTSHGRNFYVSTTDPAGEWSEPIWVAGGGIDPSLLFDDDGTVYMQSESGRAGIQQWAIDIETGKPLSETKILSRGMGGRWGEAPHLYKINGYYYLMMAEGGTEYGHKETIFRSKSPWGPFESCPHNPILTHINLNNPPIEATGHADLVQAADGSWWLVFLAFRTVGGHYHHLGRETFLAPVTWTEDGWPVVAKDGTVQLEMDAPLPDPHPWPAEAAKDDFDSDTLRKCWNFLRNPSAESWSLTERPGWLTLHGLPITLNDIASPAFVGRRQEHLKCKANTLIEFEPAADGDEAGLTVLINAAHHYDLALIREQNRKYIIVRRRIGDLTAVVARVETESTRVVMAVQAETDHYRFLAAGEGKELSLLATGSARYLSSEVAGGFTGVYFGMYSTGNGRSCKNPAAFDWFFYEGE